MPFTFYDTSTFYGGNFVWNYLFAESAVIGGQRVLSDTGAIEAALFLPHWIWAGLITAISALAIGASLKRALNQDGRTRR